MGAETPTLSFAPIPAETYGNAPFTVSATSASSGAVTYSVVSGPATISGSTVTLTGSGPVVLSASQAASGGYAAATATANFTVATEVPTLAFAPIAAQTYGNAPFPVSATSASAGAVTYSVVSGPATVSGSTVTLTGNGTVVLAANQVANGNYAAATASTTISVGAETPTLSFAPIPAETYGNAPFTVSATSASSGAVTYSVVSGPATISGSTVTLTGSGPVVLSASQAASGGYAAATATANFTVATEVPTLAFAPIAAQTYGNAPFPVSATSASAGAVTYSVVSGPATVSGSTVTLTGNGTVVLAANQVASGNYAAATATTTVSVGSEMPTLSFAPIPAETFGNAPFTVSATSISPGAVSYSVVSGPATISGSTVTSTGAGPVVLSANQVASGSYAAATASTNFVVNPEVPTLTFAPIATQTFGKVPFTVSASSASAGAVTYSVIAGPATDLRLYRYADRKWHRDPGRQPGSQRQLRGRQRHHDVLSVGAQSPTLTFAPIATHTFGDAAFTVSATSVSPGAVTYSVVSGPATISGSTVTLTGAGSVVLAASQAANDPYASAAATTSFTVNPATPTLTFAPIPAEVYGNAPFTVSATSASSGAVTYSVASGPATISGSTVTLTGTGAVVLSASQVANGNYTAATASTTINVGTATPTLTFAPIAAQTVWQCALPGKRDIGFGGCGDVLRGQRTGDDLRLHRDPDGDRPSRSGCEPGCQRQLRRGDGFHELHGRGRGSDAQLCAHPCGDLRQRTVYGKRQLGLLRCGDLHGGEWTGDDLRLHRDHYGQRSGGALGEPGR